MGTVTGRPPRRTALPAIVAGILAATSVIVAPVANLVQPSIAAASGTFADPHFADFPVFTGLDHPTTLRFASDGRAFVAQKGGVVKAFDSIADPTPTTVIDLSGEVMDYWDRGLVGMALDPDFLAGRPYLYLFYASKHNVSPTAGGIAPTDWPDSCPNPPAGTTDGCPVDSHLDRVWVDVDTNVAVDSTDPGVAHHRVNLLTDWCQQFPSHSGGGLAFGPDGQLYLSGGDGASFNGMDYGQLGGTKPDGANPVTPVNPCGDPVTVTSPPGRSRSPSTSATAAGGMLRSQDVRTTGDPLGLDGAMIRIDPDTGAGSPGNPLAGLSGANTKRIIAHGFRNPYRLTFRPGTSDLYVGDVGNGTWEEVDRVPVPSGSRTPTTLPNFGWPCYEGAPIQTPFKDIGTNLCAGLYAQGGRPVRRRRSTSTRTAAAPGFNPKGPCFAGMPNQTSSITGLAFYEGATAGSLDYPAKYDGALFFVDYSRNCLGAILANPSTGVPDPATAEQVASNVAQPVDLVTGPGGDLYYVDHGGGRVMRVRYLESPVARATVSPGLKLAPACSTSTGRPRPTRPPASRSTSGDGTWTTTGRSTGRPTSPASRSTGR